MRRIVLAVMSTIAAVVVLFGYRTSTSTPVSTATAVVAAGSGAASPDVTGTTPAAPRSTSAAPTAGSTPTATPATPAKTPATTEASTATAGTKTAATKTVTGQTEDTRWGPVQVQITVSSGKITAVSTLQLPSGNGRDAEINDAAVPILKQETLQAQSATIDAVSGATYTSQGYIASLQSALDQAGL